MRRFKKIFVIFFSAAMLSGCYPTGEKTASGGGLQGVSQGPSEQAGNNSQADNEGENFYNLQGEKIYFESEKLTVDVKLPEKIPASAEKITLRLKVWDEDFLRNTLLKGKNITESDVRPEGDEMYEGENFYFFETDDHIRVVSEPGRLDIYDRNEDEFQRMTAANYAKKYYSKYPYDLAAFSFDDAKTRVEKTLSLLGVENYGEPLVMPLRAEDANALLQDRKEHSSDMFKDGQFDYTPWTENEEIYVLVYPLVYNNIETTQSAMQIPQAFWATNGTRVEAVVSKDRIHSLKISDAYETNFERGESVPVKYSPEDAAESLRELYSYFAVDWSFKLDGAKLVYIPCKMKDHKNIIYSPAWEFSGYVVDKAEPFDHGNKIYEYFFADTGIRSLNE